MRIRGAFRKDWQIKIVDESPYGHCFAEAAQVGPISLELEQTGKRSACTHYGFRGLKSMNVTPIKTRILKESENLVVFCEGRSEAIQNMATRCR